MSSGSRISTGSSNHRVAKEVLCDCKLPTRIRTSKTKDNPGKNFRMCPNSLKLGEKCKVWEWIDEEPENMKPIAEDTLSDVADYLIQVLEDVTSVREEVKQLKVMVCVLIMLVIVKVMFSG
ncbi:uncharacterized protein LOC111902909 [Lactuca sativa]|uniref:GRF-type domain-containing protein n=1 Tax=Lactuca sativa TaxID=4236 RepID=A0A9R1VF28_LACSA|nr:uncharacterized protein LOC111902909 [Lactuca sativa]XP_042758414.1 uncharacterized protein LOC111902909 [Lactuca sativa]XP_042758415.1 uncharacterized protein LOC111902909 [Lactuca sativa]XP_042758416.1 uncharacterized protein LOC111902909 [Lactuca sativa]KAJ0204104.1 hypothetical protein LSAT_V11C500242270 [Lactuca sativa]